MILTEKGLSIMSELFRKQNFQNLVARGGGKNKVTENRNRKLEPGLVWLSGLSASLQTKGSLVGFPGRAHAWAAG